MNALIEHSRKDDTQDGDVTETNRHQGTNPDIIFTLQRPPYNYYICHINAAVVYNGIYVYIYYTRYTLHLYTCYKRTYKTKKKSPAQHFPAVPEKYQIGVNLSEV